MIFVGFVLLFFFMSYMIEQLVDRILFVMVLSMKRVRFYFFMLMVLFLLGSTFVPEPTEAVVEFVIKSSFSAVKIIINAWANA